MEKEGKRKRASAIPKFPNDMINNLLLLLPGKSLLRFRSLSKQWCAVIDSIDFVKQHLNHSIQTRTNQTLIIQKIVGQESPYKVAPMVLPVNPNKYSVKILGSCDGLLCLLYQYPIESIIVWNPTTRKHLELPAVYPNEASKEFTYGFGYDSRSDDYKVVRLQFSYHYPNIAQTSVYSLRSNVWKIIHNLPTIYHIVYGYTQGLGVSLYGAIHWIAKKNETEFENSCDAVGAFDLGKEEYKTITLPDVGRSSNSCLFLSELGGCLSIVCECFGVIGVWVMKDYGVEESWTNLITLSYGRSKYPEYMIPLAYSEKGDEVVLMISCDLFFYNLETRQLRIVSVACPHVCHPTYSKPPMMCLESLVSLGENAENDHTQGVHKAGLFPMGSSIGSELLRLPLSI